MAFDGTEAPRNGLCRWGSKFLPLNTSTLSSDRISRKAMYVFECQTTASQVYNFSLLICASFREKWSTVYRLVYNTNGLIISLCFMISVFWNEGYFVIVGFICITLNSISFWISAALAFERMLLQIFFSKLYGITSQHAIITSAFIFYLLLRVIY